MITVKKILPNEELYFVWADERCFAFFYLLSSAGEKPVWAVSGEYKPLAANVDDFDSYDHALKFIMAHAPIQ
jgi:murein tripeptide amidase MpaA